MKDRIKLASISDVYKNKKEIKRMFGKADVNLFIDLKCHVLSNIKYGFHMELIGQYRFNIKTFEVMSYGNYEELPNETEYTDEELALCKYCMAELEEEEQFFCDDWCERGAKYESL